MGTGNLGISVIWSQSVNCDLDVQTPNGKDIYRWMTNPTDNTDYGQIDAESELTGPENIFWDINNEAPSGTYNVCLEIYFFFDVVVDERNPVIATVYVRKPSMPTQIFTHTFTSRTNGDFVCNITSPAYIASFTYP